MVTYIIRRLLWAVLLLWIVSFLTFMIFYVLPAATPPCCAPAAGPAARR